MTYVITKYLILFGIKNKQLKIANCELFKEYIYHYFILIKCSPSKALTAFRRQ
uniref:Uncharacterized protein n=1 Tax=Lepeophtheirus salmonis TaxID=72036 RepID=A0A0K2TFT5_LEPSM